MPSTYEPIATTTLSSSASPITFSSIPSTYTDLRLTFTGAAVGNTAFLLRLNNQSGQLYSQTYFYGEGSGAYAGRYQNATEFDYSANSNLNTTPITFATLDIFSYTNSNYKTVLMDLTKDNNGSGFKFKFGGLYSNTSAISRIDLIAPNANFSIGTTATLYGIKNA